FFVADCQRIRKAVRGSHRDSWTVTPAVRSGRGGLMSTTSQVGDLQLLNYTLMLMVCASVNRDPTGACYQFNFRAGDVAYFKSLPVERIQAIVANVDQCLFTVRKDLLEIIDLPPGLAGVLTAVRDPVNQGERKKGPARAEPGQRKLAVAGRRT